MIKIAKIFQGGDYPDKGIKVSEKDLDSYIENFSPCQIKIEHATSVFDNILGTVQEIYRHGLELFGKIDFTKEAWALIEKSGKKSLSVAINPTLNKIEEVSLVTDPRIKDARVFSFSQDLKTEDYMDYEKKYNDLLVDFNKLKSQIEEKEAERIVEKFFAEGKITPANKDIAKILLMSENTINFHENSYSVKDLFGNFLSLSEKVDFSRIKREYKKEDNLYSQEAIDFAKKLGVNLGGNE